MNEIGSSLQLGISLAMRLQNKKNGMIPGRLSLILHVSKAGPAMGSSPI